MKLAFLLLALTTSVVAQTPAPSPASPSAPAQTPPVSTPPPAAPSGTVTPPPAPVTPPPAVVPEKPEDHNGPAYKNPKSTLPKVVGVPHVLYSLKYVDIKVGTGPLAESRKFYTVNYTGWFTDGTKFDSSFDHTPKEPITFPYGAQRVIIGWDTGFEGMRLGGKRRLYVPYQLAYGLLGRPPKMGPKANLIFDVELISQSDKPPAGTPGAAGTRPPGRAPGLPGGFMPGRPGAPPTPPAPGSPATPAAPANPAVPPSPAPASPAPATPPTPAPATPTPATPAPSAPATPTPPPSR